jgi:hypothetical protein
MLVAVPHPSYTRSLEPLGSEVERGSTSKSAVSRRYRPFYRRE